MVNSVAIIEKYPTNYNYDNIFPFKHTKFSLIPTKQDKILKNDITIDIPKIKEDYDYIILVGKEPCKFIGNISSVTEYQGYLVEDKYLGLLNPMAVTIRPSMKASFDKAISDINKVISGEVISEIDYDIKGFQNEKDIENHLEFLLENINNNAIEYIAVDTETSSLYPRNGYLLGISISYKAKQGIYIDAQYISDNIEVLLQEIFNKVTVIFHNAKYDIKWLQYHLRFNFPSWEDTLLEHYILDENNLHGLKELAIKFTNLGDYDKDLDDYKRHYCRKHKVKVSEFTYDLIPFEIMVPYACLDTAATIELHEKFYPVIKKNSKLFNIYENLLKEGTEFLIDIEETGIPIDVELTKKYIEEINQEIIDLTESLYAYKEIKEVEAIKGAVFNPNSVKHKAELFFNILKLNPIKRTATGAPSTDAETLEELKKYHALPNIINDIQKLKKTKSTYLEKFIHGTDMDGRIRTNFNLHTVTSGRLSSSGKFNAQQLPRKDKRPKKCIKAKESFSIVSQDLGTVEMYVVAVLSGDKNLQRIFIEGEDYHGRMAILKFNLPCKPNDVASLYPEERQLAKTVSFEILYKLNYNEPALENFETLKNWLQSQEEYIKSHGYIYSAFGRKRRLTDAFSPSRKDAQHEVRSGINFLVQSIASDVNLFAAIEMQKWIKENKLQNVMKIFGLVHDSILAEVRDDVLDTYTKKLAEFTQRDRGISIKNSPIGLDVQIGNNYAFEE